MQNHPHMGPLRLDGPLARRHRATLIGSGFTGPGKKLVLFFHGLGTDQTVWRSIVAQLPEHYVPLIFDLPGAGPLLPDDFIAEEYQSLAHFADDVLDLIEEIGVERCIFVGHSVSGMIGVLASIEAPETFEQIILLNASPRYLDAPGYDGGFDEAALEGVLNAMAANYQTWVAGFAPVAIHADASAAVEEFSAGLLAMRPDVTVRIARTIFGSDCRALLPLVTTPTVLIHSRSDVAVPEAVALYMHAHIPGSSLVWIDAKGHLPHMSAPQEVATALNASLARHLEQ